MQTESTNLNGTPICFIIHATKSIIPLTIVQDFDQIRKFQLSHWNSTTSSKNELDFNFFY